MKRLFLAAFFAAVFLPAAHALKVDVSANTLPVNAWDKFEITVGGDFGEGNPYDYDRINANGYFKNPSGAEKEVDGFYMRDFAYDAGADTYTAGAGGFRIRFAFNRTGPSNVL